MVGVYIPIRGPQSTLFPKLPTDLPVPGTPNNHIYMDGNGETTMFYIKIWNHPIETAIYKWLFGVPGSWCLAHGFTGTAAFSPLLVLWMHPVGWFRLPRRITEKTVFRNETLDVPNCTPPMARTWLTGTSPIFNRKYKFKMVKFCICMLAIFSEDPMPHLPRCSVCFGSMGDTDTCQL